MAFNKQNTLYSIYVVEDQHGNVKVGISTNVEQRLNGLPELIVEELYTTPEMAEAFMYEQLTHIHFHESHIEGEWFSAPYSVIVEYVSELIQRPITKEDETLVRLHRAIPYERRGT